MSDRFPDPDPIVACHPDALRDRAASGDQTLLADLFSCFRRDLLSFLSRRCGDRDDAEDAFQDAFEAAAKYLDGYRGETPLRNWLYRLAGSACTRMRRGRKNDPKLHRDLDTAMVSRAGFGPVALAPEQARASLEAAIEARLMPIESALSSLGSTDRAVLMLRDGEGMSAQEVAERLDITVPAVKSRLHRARKAMRAHLEP